MYIYVYIYMCLYLCIHIYIKGERGRGRFGFELQAGEGLGLRRTFPHSRFLRRYMSPHGAHFGQGHLLSAFGVRVQGLGLRVED